MGREVTGNEPIGVRDLYGIFEDVPGLVEQLYVHDDNDINNNTDTTIGPNAVLP